MATLSPTNIFIKTLVAQFRLPTCVASVLMQGISEQLKSWNAGWRWLKQRFPWVFNKIPKSCANYRFVGWKLIFCTPTPRSSLSDHEFCSRKKRKNMGILREGCPWHRIRPKKKEPSPRSSAFSATSRPKKKKKILSLEAKTFKKSLVPSHPCFFCQFWAFPKSWVIRT